MAVFRSTEWVSRIGSRQTAVTVVVKQPEVEHRVRMRDFETWLESNGRSPAETALKFRLRVLLGRYACEKNSHRLSVNERYRPDRPAASERLCLCTLWIRMIHDGERRCLSS